MKDKLILAAIAVACFLLGTLMPREPKIEREEVVVYKNKYYSRLDIGTITNLDIPEVRGVSNLVFVPETEVKIEYRDSIRYVVLEREHKLLENEDVKVWYSGVDPTIDSLQVLSRTVVQKEPWKRHNIGLEGSIGTELTVGVEYEYKALKWLDFSANAGYDLYQKQPYVTAGLKINLYSW